jgi:preprotein translocase subunit SecG
MQYVFMVLLFLTALFLILLVLIQRGKGGGLAGAFGGLGGQSAFGTKAGDTFTRITIGVAAGWILLCILSVKMLATTEERMQLGGPDSGLIPAAPSQSTAPAQPGRNAGTANEPSGAAPSPSGSAPAGTPGEGQP